LGFEVQNISLAMTRAIRENLTLNDLAYRLHEEFWERHFALKKLDRICGDG
jgi:hypothetical protein